MMTNYKVVKVFGEDGTSENKTDSSLVTLYHAMWLTYRDDSNTVCHHTLLIPCQVPFRLVIKKELVAKRLLCQLSH